MEHKQKIQIIHNYNLYLLLKKIYYNLLVIYIYLISNITINLLQSIKQMYKYYSNYNKALSVFISTHINYIFQI